MTSPQVQTFFDEQTSTFSYVVYHPEDGVCAVIDSVLDYDPKSGRVSTSSADKIVGFIRKKNLQVQWLLETHAHADHLSAAGHIQQQLGGKTGIGEHIIQVQHTFSDLFNLKAALQPYGSQFDQLFRDGDQFQIGRLSASVIHVPGHTPADIAYHIDGVGVFIGDTLFMPDVGTARCDFPGGDAGQLYRSIQILLGLGDNTLLYLCHDYPPDSRSPTQVCTVGDQRAGNIHIRDGISASEFTDMRNTRDKTLEMPALILPAIQINIRAGQFPPPEDNGVHYLKIPLNQF
ncbi:MBL fold metallo-hydrolase [Pollutimonas harenae]|uniref:MBL fold metallo-hydrolase n=1 Tax=Pollutimonas harenae TaxID=657015 RepID=A0A853H4I1_9BURK|nr:MBL fold metallo-hydrolase [Pollutimonas harenae]NYT86819.1 MBL fold metallo-hydrolase [Pollutimonas harenae]TEA71465.1 MBL fold metallo-hydrolase [Pollutimonas harenae]